MSDKKDQWLDKVFEINTSVGTWQSVIDSITEGSQKELKETRVNQVHKVLQVHLVPRANVVL